MLRPRSLFTALALLALCLTLTAAAGKTDATAAKLEEKGLKRVGTAYVLPLDEQVLADGLKKLREAKKKVDTDLKERKKIEKAINKAKGALGNAEFERRKEHEKLTEARDGFQQNQIVGRINLITSRMQQAMDYKAAQEEKLRKMGDLARTEYINQVIDLHKKMEEIEAKYGELAADPEVAEALASAKLKAKLGPSAGFLLGANQLKKFRSEISAETIKITMENEIPWVDVTLNGTTRTMVFDSGASSICIPYDMAKAMELIPPADAPTVRMQLADGKVVEGKMMLLKSVRVGIFEVKDVECAVLPEELVAAQPLLGGSFLRNFIYKLDPDAGELHLARLGAAEVTGPGGAGKKPEKGAAGGKVGGGGGGAKDDEEMKKE